MKKILLKNAAAILVFILIAEIFLCVPISAVSVNTQKTKYNVSEIIVKYKDTANDAISENKSVVTLSNKKQPIVKKVIKSHRMKVIDVFSADNMENAIKTYKSDPDVEYVVPNDKLTPYGLSDEPMFAQQWGLSESGVNALPSWELARGADVLVGVMDTGIDISHPDLTANILAGGWDFVNNDNTVFDLGESSHGTNVAGIIAASINNAGIAGVAPAARILPLKILEGETGYVSDAIAAIEYAKTKGIKIMNCSWGTTEFNLALKDAINNSGMLFVCATGNSGESKETYPAAFGLGNIVSVGAYATDGKIAEFTNSGQTLDLYAPGENIITTAPDNGYTTVSGTSFSAAFVTGIAALVKEAVPSINSNELALALAEGYTKRTDNGIKAADAHKAISLALPLNFIKDEDGRLSRAMKYANMLITPSVAEILTKYTAYLQLEGADKQIINAFFSISDEEMLACAGKGLDIIDLAIVILSARKADISTDAALSLMEHYADFALFDREIDNLKDLWARIDLTGNEKNEILSLIQNGYSVIQLASALIFARASGQSVAAVIAPLNGNNSINNDFPAEEKDIFNQLNQRYMINAQSVIAYIRNENLLPSALSDILFQWQTENNFFVTNGKISPYSTGQPDIPVDNKYKTPIADGWTNGNASIDKLDGMLSYNMSLLSLAGKNGLDLNLGIRFDPEVADSVNNVKASDLIENTYTITENRVFYSADQTERLSGLDSVSTCQTTDRAVVDSYISQNGNYYTTQVNSTSVCYQKQISVTAACHTDGITESSNNYYDSLYKLGTGWAFNLPSVEFVGSIKYLHFPSGQKYKINSNNTLDGYFLEDMSFQADTSFTVNQIASAYSLSDISGIRYFFDVQGKYLGSQDILGNKIHVFYNTNGNIRKIIDSTGRIIKFNYTENSVGRAVTVMLSEIDDDEFLSSMTGSLLPLDDWFDDKTICTFTEQKNSDGSFVLSEISDAAGRSTGFDYYTYDIGLKLNNQAIPNSGKSLALKSVTSQTGVVTEYTYSIKQKKYGAAGVKNYYSLTGNVDKIGSTEKNAVTYNANNQMLLKYPSGQIFPCIATSSDAVCVSDGAKEKTAFNDCFLQTSLQTWDEMANVLKTQTQITAFQRTLLIKDLLSHQPHNLPE